MASFRELGSGSNSKDYLGSDPARRVGVDQLIDYHLAPVSDFVVPVHLVKVLITSSAFSGVCFGSIEGTRQFQRSP
jgi:hypothetical protein